MSVKLNCPFCDKLITISYKQPLPNTIYMCHDCTNAARKTHGWGFYYADYEPWLTNGAMMLLFRQSYCFQCKGFHL
jgi:hypothetical protein